MIPLGAPVDDPDFAFKPRFPNPRPAVLLHREEVSRALGSRARVKERATRVGGAIRGPRGSTASVS